MVGFTRSVAADWAPHGVTVNAIAPGGFMTDANRRWFRERPEFRQDIEKQIPLGRLGEPHELGPLAMKSTKTLWTPVGTFLSRPFAISSLEGYFERSTGMSSFSALASTSPTSTPPSWVK